MLPKYIATNLGSLLAQKERLALTLKLQINKTGNVLTYEFFESIIECKKNFSYEAVERIIKGEINSSSDVRIIRDGAIIYTGKVSSIFREKNQVKQVSGGQECGITVKDYMDFQKNDIIEAFSVTSTERSI